jgi:hypothetical protein
LKNALSYYCSSCCKFRSLSIGYWKTIGHIHMCVYRNEIKVTYKRSQAANICCQTLITIFSPVGRSLLSSKLWQPINSIICFLVALKQNRSEMEWLRATDWVSNLLGVFGLKSNPLWFQFEKIQVLSYMPGLPDFLDTIYQNGGKYTKLSQHYQMAIKFTKVP